MVDPALDAVDVVAQLGDGEAATVDLGLDLLDYDAATLGGVGRGCEDGGASLA